MFTYLLFPLPNQGQGIPVLKCELKTNPLLQKLNLLKNRQKTKCTKIFLINKTYFISWAIVASNFR